MRTLYCGSPRDEKDERQSGSWSEKGPYEVQALLNHSRVKAERAASARPSLVSR